MRRRYGLRHLRNNDVPAKADHCGDAGAATLRRSLGFAEALGISIAIISPTIGMSFNVALIVGVVGVAAPLTFLLGTAMMLIVALSFVAFSRRYANAGAAYAYLSQALTPALGVLAGWATLLTYLCYSSGLAGLVGSFLTAAADDFGWNVQGASAWIALASVLGSAALAWTDVRLATRLMLALEAASVFAVLVLAVTILVDLPLHGGWSLKPFSIAASTHGWTGMGFGLVFAVLSFAGFEGAATLAEEVRHPHRTVPLAMLVSVLCAGLLFVLVSYAVVLGYGLNGTLDLANAAAPLDQLARRYLGHSFAAAINLGCAISAFSCVLGSLSGAARILFALGRGGLSRRLARIHPTHQTPTYAIAMCCVAASLPLGFLLFGKTTNDFFSDTATLGTLAIIMVYAGVTVADSMEELRRRRILWFAVAVLGTVMLCWAMLCSVAPSIGAAGLKWVFWLLIWLVLGSLASWRAKPAA